MRFVCFFVFHVGSTVLGICVPLTGFRLLWDQCGGFVKGSLEAGFTLALYVLVFAVQGVVRLQFPSRVISSLYSTSISPCR